MPSFCGYGLRSESNLHGQTAQFIAVVTQNLPKIRGEVMQEWIQNPQLLQRALGVLSDFPPQLYLRKPEVWKTVCLGTGIKSAEDFIQALIEREVLTSLFNEDDDVKNILRSSAFVVAEKETEIHLARVSVTEIGLKDGATYGQICERAEALGLQLCPLEVGPQLRLQYTDQPIREWINIGAEPVVGSDDRPQILQLFRCKPSVESWGEGMTFSALQIDGHPFKGKDLFVFVLGS